MRKILLLFVLTFLPATLLQAALPDLKFHRLDTRDGLSNSQILSICRDSRGFVWIGTPYGLNRYDGYRVRTFFANSRDTTTLRTNYVDAIFEAADGCLWLRQGMSYTMFDPVTERFERHPERILEKVGITGGLEYLYIDSHKDFWVKSYNDGFFHYSPSRKTLKRYRFGYTEQEFDSNIGVSSMCEQGDSVYLASNNGIIYCFERTVDMIVMKDRTLHERGFVSNQDCKLRPDGRGNVWAVASPSVYVWRPSNRHWHFTTQEALSAWGVQEVPAEMDIWDVAFDSRSRLWIATDRGGLYLADSRTGDMRQYLNSKYDDTSISDNTLRSIYIDQLGRVWIGTYMNGVSLFTGNTSSFRNLELGNINTLCHDRWGITWLGTNDAGIIRYNRQTGEQVVYNKENSGIGSNTMVGSLAASDGSVWFGSYEGGLIHIKRNGQIDNIRATGDTLGLANNNVWTVCEDQWGNIWIGTLGGGVQRIDRRTGSMRTFRIDNSNLGSDYISTITMTKKGWLLVSHSKYYSLINPKTFRIVNRDLLQGLTDIGGTEMSICAMEDSRQLIWQGSTAGASVWDPKTNRFYLIDMRSGLYGSTVNSIAEDKKHTMWLVTDHGISNVIPQRQNDGTYTFIVRSYNNRDGLQNGPYNQRSICYTDAGLLLVGGQGGLDALSPDNIGKGRIKEAPVFSGLQLFDQDVAVGEVFNGHVILDEALDICRDLTLRYYDQFTIQLGSSSGEIHNRSRFLYRLEGFNDNWVKTSEVNPNISYMSLPPGSYTLCVRMLNDDGTMGEDESRLDITIRPPLYLTWWAKLLYALLAVVLISWQYKYHKQRQAKLKEIERIRHEAEKSQILTELQVRMHQQAAAAESAVESAAESAADHHAEPAVSEPPLHLVMADLVGFVSTFINEYRQRPGLSLKLSFIATADSMLLRYDPDRLTRLLEILFANSQRYCPAGSPLKVMVTQSGRQAEIRIADRGHGIPEEVRSHMFEPMMDGDTGLAEVSQIATLHSGSVTADDNPGGGTIFVVRLPLDNGDDDAVPIENAVLVDE